MSDFIFDRGSLIETGSHGVHDFVYSEGTPVLDSGKSTLVFEEGTGLGGVLGPIYVADRDKAYEVDPSDGSIIQEVDHSWNPHGIGGDDTVVWSHGQNDNTIYKLDPADLSVTASYTENDIGAFTEIGGDANFIYAAVTGPANDQGGQFRVYDSSFNQLGQIDVAPEQATSIGGDSTYAHSGTGAGVLTRRDSSLNSQGVTYTTSEVPVAAGGGAVNAYVVDATGEGGSVITVLNPEDYTVRQTISVSGTDLLTGVGGV